MIIRKLKDWKFNLKDKFYAFKHGYNLSSTWSIDYFMSEKFSKMIRDLRKNKHGYPGFLEEDPLKYIGNYSIDFVEMAMKEIQKDNDSNDYDTDIFDGSTTWQLILYRIQYCFEMTNEEKYKNKFSDEYFEQVFGKEDEKQSFKEYWNKRFKVVKTDEKGKPLLYEMITNEPDEKLKENYFNEEKRIEEEIISYKNEAFKLLSEWYFHLWD